MGGEVPAPHQNCHLNCPQGLLSYGKWTLEGKGRGRGRGGEEEGEGGEGKGRRGDHFTFLPPTLLHCMRPH